MSDAPPPSKLFAPGWVHYWRTLGLLGMGRLRQPGPARRDGLALQGA